MVIYLAREPHDEDTLEQFYGEIKIFYDTPIFEYNKDTKKEEWCMARQIGVAPSYMYPTLSPEKYIKLTT